MQILLGKVQMYLKSWMNFYPPADKGVGTCNLILNGNACVTTWSGAHRRPPVYLHFQYLITFCSVMRNRIKTTSTGVAKSPVDSFLAPSECNRLFAFVCWSKTATSQHKAPIPPTHCYSNSSPFPDPWNQSTEQTQLVVQRDPMRSWKNTQIPVYCCTAKPEMHTWE